MKVKINKMEDVLRYLRKIFFVLFAGFLLFSILVIVLKKVVEVPDMITLSSKLTVVALFLMVAAILAAYFVYDRFAKKSQKIDINENEEIEKGKEEDNRIVQYSLFRKAMLIKMSMFVFVGFLSALMLLLLYQNTYLYMLGIIAVFFFINFPSDIKFKRDFRRAKELFR